jgi:signal transduction histidine kinase
MARLAEDLADAAYLAAGRFRIRSVVCDLVEIAREQVELVGAGSDRHTIQLEAPYELPTECDRDRLGQVLSNLLANAVTHTSGGQIRVRLWCEADQARLSVSDDGPGIPPDQAEAIFEPGRRITNGASQGRSKGTGLGLHIARGIVEAHGGRIWVEASPGGGATFNVALPLVPAAVGQSEA